MSALVLTGCSLVWPKKPALGILQARISPWFGQEVRIHAQVYQRDKRGRRKTFAKNIVPADGLVGFVLPSKGAYGLLAFADLNRNGRHDEGEPRTSAENLKALSPNGSGPEYLPVELHLPGRGVPQPTSERQTSQPKLTPEEATKLNLLREHLPAGVRLPSF